MSDVMELSNEFVDLAIELDAAQARENFWAFRKFIHPELIYSWWQRDVATHLQQFYADFIAGKRPTIVLSSPPRHGKSVQVRDFIAWVAGKNPSLLSIFASYSDDLGVRTNMELQRIYDGPLYQQVFPNTHISGTAVVTVVGSYQRNSSFIEYVNETGSFRNTTVMGQITGQGLDIGVIDDPMKGRAEASSLVTRNKTWNWLLDDFFSRFSDKAGMIMIMCMAGDTPVLMADGSEKPLRDIRGGDSVATYVNGGLSASKVVNWVNQGHDLTYEIKMKSGTVVRANERHPFLVAKDGEQRWVRLRNLKTGDKIIRAMPKRESGKASSVASLIATNQLVAKDAAHATTLNIDGPAGTDQHACSINRSVEPLASSIDTELQPKSMIACTPSKVENAPSVGRLRRLLIGVKKFFASITITKQEKFERCFATSVISLLDTDKQNSDCSKLLSTFEIITDAIEAITSFGTEDVFDVQIEGTENFIANSLVSHNTRWHVDDPTGRWIEHFPETQVLNYSAIAANNETYRRKGEALFPQHISLDYLLTRKALLTKASWESLYQGNPYVTGGGVLPIDLLRVLNVFDRSKIKASCRYVDKAGTKDGGAYTAMVLMHELTDGRFVIENITRGQWSALEREDNIKRLAALDTKLYSNYSVGVEQEPGSGGKESAETSVRNLAGFNVFVDKVSGTGSSKELRAEPFAAQVQGGNVWLVAGRWIPDFWDECETWPDSKYLDQVDGCSGAFNHLTLGSNYNLDSMC